MAISTIYPFGLQVDTDGSTAWSRQRIMDNFTALNSGAVKASFGLVSTRPAANAQNAGLWWVDAVTGLMSRSNGVAWIDINLSNPKPGYSEVLTSIVNATDVVVLNLGASNSFKVTMIGDITFAFTGLNAVDRSYTMMVKLVQDVTGGRTVTWPPAVKWPNGATPPISTTGGMVDVVTLTSYDFSDDFGVLFLGAMAGTGYS